MSDDPLITRIRDAAVPQPVDAERFAAGLARRRRRVGLLAGTVVAGAVALALWPADPAGSSAPVAFDAPPPAVADARSAVRYEGIARDLHGNPLIGATVTAGGTTAHTDEAGRFAFEGDPDATLRIDAPGHASAFVRVRPDRPSDAIALPVHFVGEISGRTGGTLAGPDGMTLTLPARGVKDGTGAIVEGPVGVRWTVLRTPEDLAGAPGDLATVIAGVETPLQSFGMAEVVLTDADGAELDLVADAEIELPLVDGHPFAEGQRVGLYAFDEEVGLWTDEGKGVVRDDKMVATVSHFSWWNCDEPLANTGCVCGQVHFDELLDDKPTVGVIARGVRALTMSATLAGKDGGFCVNSAPDTAVTLHAWRRMGDRCLVGQSEPVVASRAGTSVETGRQECARTDLSLTFVPCGPLDVRNRADEAPPVAVRLVARTPEVPADRVRLTRWVPVPTPPYTDLLWRCGGADWELWPTEGNRPKTFATVDAPTNCEIKFYGGRAFAFAAGPGETHVTCNVLEAGSGCSLASESDGHIADRVHLTVWSPDGVTPITQFEYRCEDLEMGVIQVAKLVGGGGDAPTIPNELCELKLHGGPRFTFTAEKGVTDVFCDLTTGGTGCRLGRPDRLRP